VIRAALRSVLAVAATLAFVLAGGPVRVSAQQGGEGPPPPSVRIELKDGTLVEGQLSHHEKGRFVVRLPDDEIRSLPEGKIRAILFLRPDEAVRSVTATAAIASKRAGGADDAEELLEIYRLRQAHRSRDEKLIREAECELTRWGKVILPVLRETYERERQFNVKVSLQWVLLSIEGRSSAREIVDAMRAAGAPDEKMRCAFMLSKARRQSDVSFLEEASQREPDPMILKYMIRALGSIGGTRAHDALQKFAIGSPVRNLRIEAIRALEESGAPAAEGVLLRVARTEEDASIKSIAVRGLANIGGRASFEFFLEALRSDDRTNNRAEAAKYMARVGEPGDVPELERIYQAEKVYYIRQKIQQAVEAIQKRGGGAEIAPPPVIR